MRISDWSSDVCSSDLLLVSGVGYEGDLRHAGLPQRLVDVVGPCIGAVGCHWSSIDGCLWDESGRDASHPRHACHALVSPRMIASSQAVGKTLNAIVLFPSCMLDRRAIAPVDALRSEEHTSELQSLMRISYAVFCLKNKKKT